MIMVVSSIRCIQAMSSVSFCPHVIDVVTCEASQQSSSDSSIDLCYTVTVSMTVLLSQLSCLVLDESCD